MLKDLPSKIPIIYSEAYYVKIGDHVFPTSKYRLLKKRLDEDDRLKGKIEYLSPQQANDDQVLLVHTKDYVNKLKTETLGHEETVRLELPVSSTLVEAAFICCGGTVLAAREALGRKAVIHLGGGFHHAFPDHGEGFCVLNDVAVSIKVLKNEKRLSRALVIDCDVHQGNGTAHIFQDDPGVFTFSIHQENNYPFFKPEGDMDIGLRDYTADREYLGHLKENIPPIISTLKPDLIVYLAGADPYKDDQLGGLALTKEGLRERDRFVCTQALNFDVPLAIVLAGGYAYNREDTVDIHYATVEECIEVFTS